MYLLSLVKLLQAKSAATGCLAGLTTLLFLYMPLKRQYQGEI